jgi:Na+/melibiose symporter-like transporter
MRGDYSAGKEMISLISGIVFTFVAGQVIDRFETLGNINGGFLFIAVAGFIISICNFVSLMLIKQDTAPKENHSASIRDVMKNTFGNRSFNNVVIMTILWDVARYITVGFLGIYKTKELMFSIGTVQLINIVGNIFRFFVSKPLGRYSDRNTYAKGIELALCIAAAAFGINIFTTPSSRWCIVIYTVLYALSIAGTNQNSFNILYSYVDSEYFVQASAIKNSIGGVIGFLSSIAGSRILAMVQANGNTFFGMNIYGQQLLSAISFAVIIATIFFVHFVIQRQNVMKQ